MPYSKWPTTGLLVLLTLIRLFDSVVGWSSLPSAISAREAACPSARCSVVSVDYPRRNSATRRSY